MRHDRGAAGLGGREYWILSRGLVAGAVRVTDTIPLMVPSSQCVMAGEPWHDDKYSVHWRYCCDHAPLGPVEQKSNRIKRWYLVAARSLTAKRPKGY